jgi:hypothetical protein
MNGVEQSTKRRGITDEKRSFFCTGVGMNQCGRPEKKASREGGFFTKTRTAVLGY